MSCLTIVTGILVCVCLGLVAGHPYYADQIPNGHAVPDMCSSGGIWVAVGHFNPHHHTHDKNPFGLDFAAAGHKWTVALCQKDSDGDGRTNGEELGDPQCTWTLGAAPTSAAIGQPGICEPLGSSQCQAHHHHFSCNCHGHNCN